MKLSQLFVVFVLIIFYANHPNVDGAPLKKLKKLGKEILKYLKEGADKNKKNDRYRQYQNMYGNPYGYKEEKYDPISVYKIPQLWEGELSIPNFLKSDGGPKTRRVQGLDNRFGIKLAVPFLGDFQYIREIGPGYYTQKLGPGDFHYPGLKNKPAPPPHYGYPEPPYKPHKPEYHEPVYPKPHKTKENDEGSYISTSYKPIEDDPEEDTLKSLRNYPWV